MPEPWILRLIEIMCRHDAMDYLCWSQDAKPAMICNDTFAYASADAVDIKPDDLALLKVMMETYGEVDGSILFCVYKREQKPIKPILDRMDSRARHAIEMMDDGPDAA